MHWLIIETMFRYVLDWEMSKQSIQSFYNVLYYRDLSIWQTIGFQCWSNQCCVTMWNQLYQIHRLVIVKSSSARQSGKFLLNSQYSRLDVATKFGHLSFLKSAKLLVPRPLDNTDNWHRGAKYWPPRGTLVVYV